MQGQIFDPILCLRRYDSSHVPVPLLGPEPTPLVPGLKYTHQTADRRYLHKRQAATQTMSSVPRLLQRRELRRSRRKPPRRRCHRRLRSCRRDSHEHCIISPRAFYQTLSLGRVLTFGHPLPSPNRWMRYPWATTARAGTTEGAAALKARKSSRRGRRRAAKTIQKRCGGIINTGTPD